MSTSKTTIDVKLRPGNPQRLSCNADAAIYRKYLHLIAHNLLYLQSELSALKGQLRDLDRKDAADINDEEVQKAARLWIHYSDEGNCRSRKHRDLQGKIFM